MTKSNTELAIACGAVVHPIINSLDGVVLEEEGITFSNLDKLNQFVEAIEKPKNAEITELIKQRNYWQDVAGKWVTESDEKTEKLREVAINFVTADWAEILVENGTESVLTHYVKEFCEALAQGEQNE